LGGFVNVLEFQRGWIRKHYGLAIVLTPAGVDALAAELPATKATILRWVETRAKNGRFVRFSVLTRPDTLDQYESVLRRFCTEDSDVAGALAGRKVVFDFGDSRGKKSLRMVELNAA
jgi:hypothetical protein